MTNPRIALCTIVRNEIRSLVEWLAHHKALGFTEVVIYDNDSTDGTTDVLRALDEAGELVHLPWPHSVGARPQRLAYEHARQHSDADWIAFFDADEFLVLHHDASIADTTDPDDAVLRLQAYRDLVEQIFFDAEFLGDGFDHGDGGDFVALHGRFIDFGS